MYACACVRVGVKGKYTLYSVFLIVLQKMVEFNDPVVQFLSEEMLWKYSYESL